MPEAIYKYPVSISPFIPFTVEMPKHPTILDVQTQDGNEYLWALVDLDEPLEEVTFIWYPTGEVPHMTIWNAEYIKTIQHPPFVWHLFRLYPEEIA